MAAQRFWLPLATSMALALLGAWRIALAQTAAPITPAADHPVTTDPASPTATTPSTTPPADAASGSPADKVALNAQQSKLAARYKELERVMLRMAEVMQSTDPKRAALLRQAFAQSQQHQIDDQYADLVKLLSDEQLHQAAKGQVAVQQELNRLLELLVSGDRDKQIPNERAEVKKFIERVNKLIREEQGIQGETEGQGDPADLAKRQANAAEKAAELSRDIDEFDGRNNPNGNTEAKPGENAEGKDSGGKDKDGKNADGKSAKNDKESKSGDDAKKGDADGKNGADEKSAERNSDGKNDEGKSPDGKQPDGQNSDGQKSGGKSSDRAGKKSDGKSDQKSTDGENSGGDQKGEKGQDQKQNGKSQQDQKNHSKKGESGKNSSQKGDSQKSDSQKNDSQKGGLPSDDEQKSDSSKSRSKSGKSQDGQPDDENDGDQKSQQSGGDQQQDENPARKRVRQAEDRMREARRKLEEAQRRGAAEDQQQAIEELKQAKAALEEILRQLREEEIERVLAQLEGRFRKMLQMEIEVYEGTIRLDGIPDDERDRELEIQSGKLSRQQTQVAADAEKTLNLLREEGSSVAFPESVEQMHDDMQSVAARLSRANVGQITQGIEQDVVKSLEEMVAALQKAQKDQQRQKQAGGPQPPQGGAGGNQDQPLVNAIAELKMIRALQVRVNTRTQRYSQLLSDGAEQAEQPDLVDALQRLSEREERIHKATREIVVGKNR